MVINMSKNIKKDIEQKSMPEIEPELSSVMKRPARRLRNQRVTMNMGIHTNTGIEKKADTDWMFT